jgi:basic amino acid/polyamine antiporter, APA family
MDDVATGRPQRGGVPVAAQSGPAAGEGETKLNRAIGPKLLLFFIVGDILGGGIYALVGEVGAETGGAIWAAFMLALAMAVFTAGSYAELVTKYPRAGGAGLYVHRAFGVRFVTFLVAFAVMASGVTSASTLARAFGGDYLSEFVDIKVIVTAIALLVVIALVNLRGIEESVKLNVGFTLVEAGGLLLIILISIVALGQGDVDAGRAFEFKDGSSILVATLAGAALAFYALIGFEDSVNLAEEVKNPTRVYPKALFGGIAIAGVIYLLVTIGASMVVPTADLAASDGPLLEVVKQGPLGIDTKLFSAIGLLALANGALINMIMASRLLYGMSEERVLPRAFSQVLAGRRTPWVAIAFTTLLGAVLVITGDLEKLADTTVALLVVVFAIVNVCVLVLRREEVGHDHFRVPSAMPVIGVGISIALLTQVEGDAFARAGIVMVLGLGMWLVNYLVLRREDSQGSTT